MNIPLQSTSHDNSDHGNIADAWSMKSRGNLEGNSSCPCEDNQANDIQRSSIQSTQERIHFPSRNNTCNTNSHTCTDIEIGA